MKSGIRLIITIFAVLLSIGVVGQQKQKIVCVAFYNIENLFDTIDDPGVNDVEFTPSGPNRWNTQKYYEKLNNISKVISRIGDEYVQGGPVVIGLSEVENTRVLEDLVNTPILKPLNYGVILIDGPDRRGVDVALLYRKDYFVVTNVVSARLRVADQPDFLTRDQLVVSGILDGDPMHFIVNHWPSRRGGEKRSAPLREAAARLCRSLSDSLQKAHPGAKVLIMGDFNDNPTDASMHKVLGAKADTANLAPNGLFNPYYRSFKKLGIGSNAYRDSWSNFDMIVISKGLLNPARGYRFHSALIFNRPFLLQQEGAFKGYPLRTYVGQNYMGGYSDHFPVYLFLVK
jgi:hypothetical protein